MLSNVYLFTFLNVDAYFYAMRICVSKLRYEIRYLRRRMFVKRIVDETIIIFT